MPVVTSASRYFLAGEPIHPSGKNFFSPVEYGGFYLEAHNNRQGAIRQLKNFVESLQIGFENIEDDNQITDVESSIP